MHSAGKAFMEMVTKKGKALNNKLKEKCAKCNAFIGICKKTYHHYVVCGT